MLVDVALALLCAAFVFVVGRNDGSILVAFALQQSRMPLWVPLALLAIGLPLFPWIGVWAVADSLETMSGLPAADAGESLAILTGAIVTVLISVALRVPTSITLALVGAIAGAALAADSAINWSVVTRVLLLGLLAPLLTALIAAVAGTFQPQRLRINTGTTVAGLRLLTLVALMVAYSVNDGQKALFALALARQEQVSQTASSLLMIAVSGVFVVGALSGLRSAGQFVRNGVTVTRLTDLLVAEASTATTVIGGSLIGVPLSMTQSLTGGLLGAGVSRSRRAVHWQSAMRIGQAWIWTLPVAALLGAGLTALLRMAGL